MILIVSWDCFDFFGDALSEQIGLMVPFFFVFFGRWLINQER